MTTANVACYDNLIHPSVTDAIFPTQFPLPSERFPIEASKWKLLGEALSFDDDRLDEIFTNNETDEACLQEMLEIYTARPNFKHNWEEIREAIKKIGEETSGMLLHTTSINPPPPKCFQAKLKVLCEGVLWAELAAIST